MIGTPIGKIIRPLQDKYTDHCTYAPMPEDEADFCETNGCDEIASFIAYPENPLVSSVALCEICHDQWVKYDEVHAQTLESLFFTVCAQFPSVLYTLLVYQVRGLIALVLFTTVYLPAFLLFFVLFLFILGPLWMFQFIQMLVTRLWGKR